MADNRNYIERSLYRSKVWNGDEQTPEELSIRFAVENPTQRLEILDSIAADISSDDDLSFDRAVKLSEYSAALQNMDRVLRKAGR